MKPQTTRLEKVTIARVTIRGERFAFLSPGAAVFLAAHKITPRRS